MRNLLIAFLLVLLPITAFSGLQVLTLDNNVVYSGSKYASQVTPPESVNIQGQTREEYLTMQNGMRRGFKPDPEDPYPTPIGDISWVIMLGFVCVYILATKYKKE